MPVPQLSVFLGGAFKRLIAGHALVAAVLSTDEDSWARVLEVNATGYFLGARAAVRQMLQQGKSDTTGLRGRVINISSQHGMVACPGDIAYGVGKAAAV